MSMSPHDELRAIVAARVAQVLDGALVEQVADAVAELFYTVEAYWSLGGSPYLIAEAKSTLRPVRPEGGWPQPEDANA